MTRISNAEGTAAERRRPQTSLSEIDAALRATRVLRGHIELGKAAAAMTNDVDGFERVVLAAKSF